MEHAVFGRGETFDPQSDPVVRLEARRLRRDLDSYYVDAGARDPVRITIPEGRLRPAFRVAPGADDAPPSDATEGEAGERVVEATGAAAAAEETAGDNVRRTRPPRRPRSWPVWLPSRSWRRSAGCGSGSAARPGRSPRLSAARPSSSCRSRRSAPARTTASWPAGVTQELITDLMRFDGFRLYSVPASFRQDEHADPVTLGHDLGVELRRQGQRQLRRGDRAGRGAALQCADRAGASGARPTTARRPRGDLLGLRAELAANIATVLGQPYGVVTSDLSARLTTGVAPSMASYACVLRAYTYRRTFRDELRQPVLACLDAAVQRDPGYAEAWALLGWLHLDAARYAFVPDAEIPSEMGQAFDMASKAVAIEPENVVALQALSAVQYHLGNFDESERIQRQALALNPNDPDTLAQLGWRLALRGRWDEGLAYSERAIARTVDPPGWYYDPIDDPPLPGGPLPRDARLRRTLGGRGLPRAWRSLPSPTARSEIAPRRRRRWPGWRSRRRTFNRDPAAAWRRFQPLDSIVDALMDGLRKAGWNEPGAVTTVN